MRRAIKFTDEYSLVPLIKLTYGPDKEFYAIIDTGSESTLVDKSFVKDIGLTVNRPDKTFNLIGFLGTKEADLQTVKIPCYPEDEELILIELDCIVSDLSAIQSYFDKWSGGEVLAPMLIGSDELSKLNATIDFENKLFEFDL